MGPPRRETPGTTTGGSHKDSSTTTTELVDSIDEERPTVADLAPAQIRRRRTASWRLVPLDGEVNDPFDRLASPSGPSNFGLCRGELAAEIGRCQELGWSDWEIVARFTDPKQVAA